MPIIFSRNSVFFFTRLLLQCNFNQELSVRQKNCRFLDLLTSYNSKHSSSEMSPSSKLGVCLNVAGRDSRVEVAGAGAGAGAGKGRGCG